MTEPVEIIRKRKAQTYEIDFAGVMSNQVYFRWLEDLRTDIIQEFVDLRELIEMGSVPVLAHSEIDYKLPVRLLEEVECRMWVEEMSSMRWAVAAEFKVHGKVCTKSKQWGVFVDTKTMRPVLAPDVFLGK